MRNLATYVGELDTNGPVEFLRMHPFPVLVSNAALHPRVDLSAIRDRTEERDTTQAPPSEGGVRLIDTDAMEEQPIVVELRPEMGTSPQRLDVGRSRQNHLCLPLPKVSKFHASFTWSSDGREYYLVDAQSTNGSFVDGVRLVPGQKARILGGSEVKFGPYVFTFYAAGQFREYIERLLETVP